MATFYKLFQCVLWLFNNIAVPEEALTWHWRRCRSVQKFNHIQIKPRGNWAATLFGHRRLVALLSSPLLI